MRVEAARVGRWWPWLDSNGVTLFVQQYHRGTWYELLLVINTWYMVPVPGIIRDTRGLRKIRKIANCLVVHGPAHTILHSYKEFKMKRQTEGAKRVHFWTSKNL